VELKDCRIDARKVVAPKQTSKNATRRILYLNGLISSHRIFSPLIKELAKSSQHLEQWTLNVPPHGRSRLNEQKYTWVNIQSCLAHYFQKNNFDILVFHDLSAALVLPLMDSLKVRPKGIVLINALIRPSEFHLVYPFTLLESKLTGKITSQVFPEFLYKREIKKLILSDPLLISDDTLDALFGETFGGKSSAVAELVQSYPNSPDIDQRIMHTLRNPAIKQLVIWGLKDPILKRQLVFLDETSTHPHRTTFYLKEGKHFSMWEFPTESAAAITSWIKSHRM
jgi:pimeloyl-ACP methyl ester carboxylesterase